MSTPAIIASSLGIALIIGVFGFWVDSCQRLDAERFKACVQLHAPLECRAAAQGAR